MKEYDNFKVTEPYYNGYRLLSTLDRNKEKPEIFASTTNRSAGKTIFFNGNTVHKFIQKGEKFVLLYRHKYEISEACNGFFGEIKKLFFPDLEMKQEPGVKDVFDKLYLGVTADETGKSYKHCGYATALSSFEQIKRYSHLLSDCSVIIFDEFMPENGRYLKNEISMLMSIHDSLARGNGKQVRYLPVIMIGNLIDIFNPYYEAFGIVDDMQINTKFYRGTGFVIEQGFNEASASAHADSSFHKAFSGATYTKASQQKEYINTSYQFIDSSVADIGRYVLTLKYKDKLYSVRINDEFMFWYVSDHPDPSYKQVHAVTENDISENAIYDIQSIYRKHMKDRMRKNRLKFKNLQCRSAALHYIAGK